MANNRLYLVIPSNGGVREVLIAKGWRDGWHVWKPEDLAERIAAVLEGSDIEAARDGSATLISLRTE